VLRRGNALVYQAGADPMRVLSVAEAHSGKTLEADGSAEAEANARFIVHAANCHHEMLEALEQAVEEIEDLRRYANSHGGMIDDERCDYGREAIRKARSGAEQ
jgi:hypothetical protein